MDKRQMFARIGADQDQDIEHAKEWMRKHDDADLIAFWLKLNKSYPNPTTEIITRFAIIGFVHVVQAMEAEGEDDDA